MPLLLLCLFVLCGCTHRPENEGEVSGAAAKPQEAAAPAQPDAGCPPVTAATRCAEQGRQCGKLVVTDACGNAQAVTCGPCAQGHACTPSGQCEEVCRAGQQRCCDGQCAAPSDCAVLVCDPKPAAPTR
jgi:hypothetical protein